MDTLTKEYATRTNIAYNKTGSETIDQSIEIFHRKVNPRTLSPTTKSADRSSLIL
jgi:hypothetical protein